MNSFLLAFDGKSGQVQLGEADWMMEDTWDGAKEFGEVGWLTTNELLTARGGGQ